jgi:hypothetical protein
MSEEELPGDDRFTGKPQVDWARPMPPPVRTPVPDPSEDEAWGRLKADCRECGGRYGHEALCPTGIESEQLAVYRDVRDSIRSRIEGELLGIGRCVPNVH